MTRVMLSSTWSDLVDYREKVRLALDRLRHIGLPVEWIGMEAFPASSNHDVRTEILGRVAACDLYVGVLGHRYGSLSPQDAVSFVELEYNEAIARGLPRLLFVMEHETARAAGDSEDGQQLHDLRARFLNDRLVGHFNSPDDLALQVVIALLPDLLVARESATNVIRAAMIEPRAGGSIALTASPAVVFADGVSTATVTATLTDSSGSRIDREAIIWSIAGFGTLNPVNTQTIDGRAVVVVTPLPQVSGGRIVVSCVVASSGAAASIALDLVAAPDRINQ